MDFLNLDKTEATSRDEKRKSFEEYARSEIKKPRRGGKREEQIFEEDTTYEPLNPKAGQGIDIGLMIYTLRKKQKKMTLIRDFIFCYLPYVVLMVLWLTFSSFIFDAFWLNDGLKALLLRKEVKGLEIKRTFKTITNGKEYWQWIHDIIPKRLFEETDVNGQPLPANRKRYAQIYNKQIGSIRFRQTRSQPNSCVTTLPRYGVNEQQHPNSTLDFDLNCYRDEGGLEDRTTRRSFGVENRFKFQECETLGGGCPYVGEREYYGNCDGYAVELPFSYSQVEAIQFLKKLQSDGWIDKFTRVAYIELFTYNPNLNYFNQIKLVVEFTAGGGLIPTWLFRVFKLEVLRTTGDYIIFILILFLPLFSLYNIFNLIKQLYLIHRDHSSGSLDLFRYFKIITFWNILDFLNATLYFTSFVMRLYWQGHPDRERFQITTLIYPHLDDIAYIYYIDLYISSFNVILTFIVCFKYFEAIEKLNVLVRTIADSAWNLIAISIILLIALVSFSLSGLLIFGMKFYLFRNFETVMMTLLRLLLADFVYSDFREESRTFAAIYYIAFLITSFFLILNMFLAVIAYQFDQIVEESRSEGEGKYVVDSALAIKDWFLDQVFYFYDYAKEYLKPDDDANESKKIQSNESMKFDQGDKALIQKLAEAHEQKGGNLTVEDLKRALGTGVDVQLVQRIMRRFDLDGDGTISLDEIKRSATEDQREYLKLRREELENLRKSQIRDASRKSIGAQPFIDEKDKENLLKSKMRKIDKQLTEIIDLYYSIPKSKKK
eukprot:gene5837-9660_t